MKRRITGFGALAGLIVTAGMLTAPTAGATGLGPGAAEGPVELSASGPAPLHAAGEPGSCTVSGGSLSWGVKESFRAYIGSAIAKGSWTPADGAAYETPNFIWTGSSGDLHTADGAGNVSFTGSVTFTAHGDVLNMMIANPTIEFSADGTARLLVDARSNDTTGALVIDEKQAELAAVSLPKPVAAETGTVSYTDLPLTLTEAGVPVFGSFYDAGVDLDPLTVSFDLECTPAETKVDAGDGASGGEDASEPTAAEAGGSGMPPWLPVVIGSAAVVAGGTTAAVVASRRKKNGTDASA